MVDASKDRRNTGTTEPGASDMGLTLGRDIYAKYSVSPGIIASPAGFGIARQTALFGMERLPLLASIQRRFGGSSILPSGWPASHFVWALNRSALSRSGGPGIVAGTTADRPTPSIARVVAAEIHAESGGLGSGVTRADSHAIASPGATSFSLVAGPAALSPALSPGTAHEVHSPLDRPESFQAGERSGARLDRAPEEGTSAVGSGSVPADSHLHYARAHHVPAQPTAQEPNRADLAGQRPSNVAQGEATVLARHATQGVVSSISEGTHHSAGEDRSDAGGTSTSLQPSEAHDGSPVAGEGYPSASALVERVFERHTFVGRSSELGAINRTPGMTHDATALLRSAGSAELESAIAEKSDPARSEHTKSGPGTPDTQGDVNPSSTPGAVGSRAPGAVVPHAEPASVSVAPRMIARTPSAFSSSSRLPIGRMTEPRAAANAETHDTGRSEFTRSMEPLAERTSGETPPTPRSASGKGHPATIPLALPAIHPTMQRPILARSARGARSQLVQRELTSSGATVSRGSSVSGEAGGSHEKLSAKQETSGSGAMGATERTLSKSHLSTSPSGAAARQAEEEAATASASPSADRAVGEAGTVVAKQESTGIAATGATAMTLLESRRMTSASAAMEKSRVGQETTLGQSGDAVATRVHMALETAPATRSAAVFPHSEVGGGKLVGVGPDLVHRHEESVHHEESGVMRAPVSVAETATVSGSAVARSTDSAATTHIAGVLSTGEKSSPETSAGANAGTTGEAEGTSTPVVVRGMTEPISVVPASVGRSFDPAQHLMPEFSWRTPGAAGVSTTLPHTHRAPALLASRSEAKDMPSSLRRAASATLTYFAPQRAAAGPMAGTQPSALLRASSLTRLPSAPTLLMPAAGLPRAPSGEAGSGVGTSGGATAGSTGAAELPALSAAANTAPKGLELNQLANRVYELLVRRLASERQRRGF